MNRAVELEKLRLQIILSCKNMIPPSDEFRNRIRNHMVTMVDQRQHNSDLSMHAHWSQIIAAIMSADPKHLPEKANDPIMIYVLRLRNVCKWLQG